MTNLTDRLTDFAEKVLELRTEAFSRFEDANDAEVFYFSTLEGEIQDLVEAVNDGVRKVLQ